MRFLVSTGGEHDLLGSNFSRRGAEKKCAIVGTLQAGDGDAFTHWCVEALRVRDKVADDLVPGHEAVGVIAAIASAGELDGPVWNDEAEAVPAPTPGLPHPAALENDVLDARRRELVANRKSTLSRADDYNIDCRIHRPGF